MKKLHKCILLFVNLFLFSCATFTGKNNQEIEISTSPSDAYVYVDGWVAKTPAKVNLTPSMYAYTVKVKKDGYQDTEVKINRRIRYREVFLDNLLWVFGYPVAVYIDFSNGKAFELQDTQVSLKKNN